VYWHISHTKPDDPGGGATLFLAGADHGYCEIEKRTRRYLQGTAVSLKKGDFNTPSVNPFFQKENGGLKCNISKPPSCAARPITTVL